MTFIEYLRSLNISSDTPGPEAYIYTEIAAMSPDVTYREASLVFADLPGISDAFGALWYGYESELDRQNYERGYNEPKHVSLITGRVLYGHGKNYY